MKMSFCGGKKNVVVSMSREEKETRSFGLEIKVLKMIETKLFLVF